MFDHNLYQENLVGVDFCERMVRETNRSVLELAERTEAPTPASTATAPSPTSCGPSTRWRATSTSKPST